MQVQLAPIHSHDKCSNVKSMAPDVHRYSEQYSEVLLQPKLYLMAVPTAYARSTERVGPIKSRSARSNFPFLYLRSQAGPDGMRQYLLVGDESQPTPSLGQ